jgi:hypothetical protein
MITLVVNSTLGREHIDLDALETAILASSRAIGCRALQTALDAYVTHMPPQPILCPAGHPAHMIGVRPKTMNTTLGPVLLHRPYYHDPMCRSGHAPLDHLLDIEGTAFSPGLRNMMANVGCDGPFKHSAEQLKRLAGVVVTAKSIERVCAMVAPQVEKYRGSQQPGSDVRASAAVTAHQTMYVLADGTGFPVLKRETAGRKGKGKDGKAKTREMKLGCVFTQTRRDEKGYPIRDVMSTSYVAACETSEDFGPRLLHEALVRGLDQVKKVLVLGDGAKWIWHMADEYYPNAVQIVDLCHAREHYQEIAKCVFPAESEQLKQWCAQREVELDAGQVKEVITALKGLNMRSKAKKKKRDETVTYFRNNAKRMRYDLFRAKGYFVGSGVVEAGCRTVVGVRIKQSGMHWTVKAGQNIATLRCLMLSGLWDDFWESRAAA